MNEWTEESLRKAASWKAFKEGKSLFELGSVSGATRTPDGWKGTVSQGKRPLRVSVVVKSPTHIEARCPCPENQSTGAICSHAVAAGLACLGNSRQAATPQIEPAPAKNPPRAYRITLPAQWHESLRRGKLAVTLGILSDTPPSPADETLESWLLSAGAKPGQSTNLLLDASRLAEFLPAISDHPAVFPGKDAEPVTVASGHRMRITSKRPHDGTVEIAPESGDSWICLENQLWHIGQSSISRAGNTPLPASLLPLASKLCHGQTAAIRVEFLLENLIAWQDWLVFPDDDWLESLHFVPAPATLLLSLDGSLQELSASLQIGYGASDPVPPGFGQVKHLPMIQEDRCLIRNHQAELDAVQTLERNGFSKSDPSNHSWKLKGEKEVIQFLSHTLPELRNSWSVSESARLLAAKQTIRRISPSFEIIGSGEDWLSFNLSFQSDDGVKIPNEEIRQLLRSGAAKNHVKNGRRLVLDQEAMELIDPLMQELDLRQVGGHFEANKAAAEVIQYFSKYHSKKLNVNESETNTGFRTPSGLRADLRPYQQAGAAWLADRVSTFGGALLADDMGLGKTIQTIACIEHLFELATTETSVVLVVATTSLLGNWRAEFAKFAPGRTVRILHGSGRDQERERISPGDVVLTSYGTLARDLAWHLKQEYLATVIDEASLMRNPDTDHAKAVCKLRAKHRIALTGTPVENSLRDLWSIFRFIQPGWLGNRADFKDRYETPAFQAPTSRTTIERLKLKTHPFLLRRTKDQVAPELPSKIVIDEFCDLSTDQQSMYRSLLDEGRKQVDSLMDTKNQGAARMRMLTTLLRLRQTCCDLALLGNDRLKQLSASKRSGKLERLFELLDEALSGNHKILVFSQFQKQLLEIEKQVTERGWSCLRLDGQTKNRQQLVDRFQSPDGPPLFLISLKAGGYGLNLTAADIVIHFDPWWNPAAEAQATDRAHRIGQTRPVTVYRLLTRGTVEEKVIRLQSKKRDLASGIDESGETDSAHWTTEELKEMLRT